MHSLKAVTFLSRAKNSRLKDEFGFVCHQLIFDRSLISSFSPRKDEQSKKVVPLTFLPPKYTREKFDNFRIALAAEPNTFYGARGRFNAAIDGINHSPSCTFKDAN